MTRSMPSLRGRPSPFSTALSPVPSKVSWSWSRSPGRQYRSIACLSSPAVCAATCSCRHRHHTRNTFLPFDPSLSSRQRSSGQMISQALMPSSSWRPFSASPGQWHVVFGKRSPHLHPFSRCSLGVFIILYVHVAFGREMLTNTADVVGRSLDDERDVLTLPPANPNLETYSQPT